MKTKKIAISGLAFKTYFSIGNFSVKWGEEYDMERLTEEAKLGWITKEMKGTSYILVKDHPQELIYSIDYKDHPDQDYFDIFKEGGWTHISSIGYIHLFKAPVGTKSIHTSNETKIEKLSHEMRRYGLWTLLAITLLFLANGFTSWASNHLLQWGHVVAIILNIISLVFLVFTILPFFGYWSRVRKLKKNKI
jgi:hypothetical protein